MPLGRSRSGVERVNTPQLISMLSALNDSCRIADELLRPLLRSWRRRQELCYKRVNPEVDRRSESPGRHREPLVVEFAATSGGRFSTVRP